MKHHVESAYVYGIAVAGMVLASSFYGAHAAPPTDVVAHWKFDEGTGTVVADSSGNKYNGTTEFGPEWVDGVMGKAMKFNGTDQYVTVPDNNLTEAVYAFSVSVWFKPTEASTTQARGVIGIMNDLDRSAFNIGIDQLYDGNDVYFRVSNIGNIAEKASADQALGNTKWNHVVGIYNGEKLFLYQNGVLQKNNPPFTGTSKNSAKPLRMSYDYSKGLSSFPGAIDEVRIYHRALSPAEVAELYNEPVAAAVLPPPPAPEPAPALVPEPVPAPVPEPAPIPVPSPTPPPSPKLLLLRSMGIGSQGDDVLSLQKFLNARGFIISISGAGSPGNETTYFGGRTEGAIKKLQCDKKIVCAGSPSTTGWAAWPT